MTDNRRRTSKFGLGVLSSCAIFLFAAALWLTCTPIPDDSCGADHEVFDPSYQKCAGGKVVPITPPTDTASAIYEVTVLSEGTGATGGGEYPRYAMVTVTAGTPPSGYRFKEWTSSFDSVIFVPGANYPTAMFSMPARAVTVTAAFDTIPATPKYTVTVSSVGTGATQSGSYAAGDTVMVTTGMPPEGYQFKEWTSSVDRLTFFPSVNNATVIFIMPDTAVTVTAVFESLAAADSAYTITFNANADDGTVTPASLVTSALGKLATLPVPEKRGYTFGGWFNTSADTGGTRVDTGTVFRADTVIYARWAITTYPIEYNLNGGTAPTPANPTSYTVATPHFALNNPTRSGYDFVGWTEVGSTANMTTSMFVYEGSTGNKRYTANWIATAYTITYNLNGGTVAAANPNPTSYTIETADFTLNNPTKTGNTFTGWTTGNDTIPKISVTVAKGSTGNRTYTANWTAVSAPTYKLTILRSPQSGGSTTPSDSLSGILAEATVNISATAGSGYKFKNWTSADTAVRFGNADSVRTSFTMPARAVTVTANFDTVAVTPTYLVTIAGGGTSASGGGSYRANDTVKIKAGTPPTGHTFKNWTSADTVAFGNANSDSTSFVMPAKAVTVTANFTQTGRVPGDTLAYQGKKYPTVKIGVKTWMAENLNYDTLGSTDSWCYENSTDSCNKYGRLYNWSRAKTVCPTGWHLPDTADWNLLVTTAGGVAVAGKKLKSTTGWNGSGNGTNDFGFSALPGGFRDIAGDFDYIGEDGYWWTVTESAGGNAYDRRIYSDYDEVNDGSDEKTSGYSVRCVKND
ncbi:hypothetical protein R80B4_00727 [Fibrobacteres bacterium R8-0-B4]